MASRKTKKIMNRAAKVLYLRQETGINDLEWAMRIKKIGDEDFEYYADTGQVEMSDGSVYYISRDGWRKIKEKTND